MRTLKKHSNTSLIKLSLQNITFCYTHEDSYSTDRKYFWCYKTTVNRDSQAKWWRQNELRKRLLKIKGLKDKKDRWVDWLMDGWMNEWSTSHGRGLHAQVRHWRWLLTARLDACYSHWVCVRGTSHNGCCLWYLWCSAYEF